MLTTLSNIGLLTDYAISRRAWHRAQVPSSTMRLASHYIPLKLSQTQLSSIDTNAEPRAGTLQYYIKCIGGTNGLAQLYFDAGMLHLEGAASSLLASSYSSLSSIRLPTQTIPNENSTTAWKRDREAALRYFERAKILDPTLEIPPLPEFSGVHELEMPTIDMPPTAESVSEPEPPTIRRRRKKEEMALLEKQQAEEMDNNWYFFVPQLVGAGTALLVVGIVGALSFSTWSRRNQGS